MEKCIYIQVSGFSYVRLIKMNTFVDIFKRICFVFINAFSQEEVFFQDLYIPASINLRSSNSYTL